MRDTDLGRQTPSVPRVRSGPDWPRRAPARRRTVPGEHECEAQQRRLLDVSSVRSREPRSARDAIRVCPGPPRDRRGCPRSCRRSARGRSPAAASAASAKVSGRRGVLSERHLDHPVGIERRCSVRRRVARIVAVRDQPVSGAHIPSVEGRVSLQRLRAGGLLRPRARQQRLRLARRRWRRCPIAACQGPRRQGSSSVCRRWASVSAYSRARALVAMLAAESPDQNSAHSVIEST